VLGEHALHEIGHGSLVPELERVTAGYGAAIVRDLCANALELLEGPPGEHDPGTEGSELMGDTAPEAATPARNEHGLAFEQPVAET